MLSEADVKKYMVIQAKGIPIPSLSELITLKDAVQLIGKTKATILTARMENPAIKGQGITWFVIGPIVMLDRSSLIKVAVQRGWIEEV